MARYEIGEYFEMIGFLFENGRSAARAAAAYAEFFPNRRHPVANVISAAVRRMRETGNIMFTGAGGRPRGVKNPAMEEEVIQRALDDPRMSTRRIAREMDVSHVLVHKVLKEEKLHAFHFTRIQKFLPRDYPMRVNYSRKIL